MSPLSASELTAAIDYVTGAASPDEAARVERLAAESVRYQQFLANVQRLVELRRRPEPSPWGNAMAAIGETLRAEVSQGDPRREAHASIHPRQRLLGRQHQLLKNRVFARRALFASLPVAIMAFVAIMVARSWTHPRASTTLGAVRTLRTVAGQWSTTQLPDGSMITLGPATSVVMTATGVDVAGEAYFVIAPHPAYPFVVRTADAHVHVLGTRFTVRRYADEGVSRVAVEEGRVSLSSARTSRGGAAPTVLTPGMLGLVTDSGIVTTDSGARAYTVWTHGTLVFEGIPLRDAIAELARAYGAAITVRDTTLAKRIVRTEVQVTVEPLHRVLTSICNVTGAHLVRTGNTYVISPGHGEPARHDTIKPNLFPHTEHQYGR